MALTSPGVEVTVIDESFYTPAAPGTVPLIVVATAQDKQNAAGTGTAQATLAANATNAYKVTSQKELVDLFGVPFFEKTASSTPIHGSELNEYGLLAAYSLLGVSNSAFIVRANVNLAELEGSAEAPGANPDDGTWWVDTAGTSFGVQEWNGAAISTTGGQKFASKTPIVLTDDDTSKIDSGAPKTSVGAIGDYAVVFETVDGSGSYVGSKERAKLYYKSAGNTQAGVTSGQWVIVGSNDWQASHATITGGVTVPGTTTLTAGRFLLNDTFINVAGTDTLTNLVAKINGAGITGVTAANVNGTLYVYNDGTASADGSTADASIRIENDTADLDEIGIEEKTYYGPALQQTPHTNPPSWKSTGGDTPRPTGSVWVKTTYPNRGSDWQVKQWDSASTSWVTYSAPLYASTHASLYYLDRAGGGANLPIDSLVVQTNATENSGFDTSPNTAEFRVWRRAVVGQTSITSAIIGSGSLTGGSNTLTIAESIKNQVELDTGIAVTFTAASDATDADTMAGAINAAGFTNIVASVDSDNKITITHKLGGDFRITDGANAPAGSIFTSFNLDTGGGTANFYDAPAGASEDYIASNFKPLAADDFFASVNDPTNDPTDGTLWYNPEFSDVDIMINDGSAWVGYQNFNSDYANTDPEGPQVTASEPTVQSDGSDLVDGDIWVSTADLENFPTIYRYNGDLLEWVQIDKTDQVTEEGVLFADARYSTSGATGDTAGSIIDLLTSDFVDFDCPDPALYPKGMMLWNLRRSGGNVKRYVSNYVDTNDRNARYSTTSTEEAAGGQPMSSYATDRWVTASGNQEDGSGSFGRHAQRMVVVQALKSVVDTSDQVRDEERRNFNLIAAPGYPELMSNLVNLNIDRGLTAFVIGDTPFRLPADATSLTNWGTNANLVVDNNDDGIVTYDEYLGCFYPNGFTTDLGGSNAVVPASHMMLRTIALSDNVSYPWFAPAGTRRGGITNATAVGYIDGDTGEFQTVALNEGQRDTLYDLKVNPITFFNGVGLVNYGQKTRARNASALDRINVARLVVYLRTQLNRLARPYIFEPNDKITRDEIKQAVESLLLELVGLRALYDFAVVCDESNNTPARVDRNELYVDIAIEPVKAVEFIYIPLRVKNTGEI